MRFGLIANLRRQGAVHSIHALLEWIEKNRHQIIVDDTLKSQLPNHSHFVSRTAIASQVDMMISMGGDGTLLSAARAVGTANTPILGINLGSLGFLTQQSSEALYPALEAVVRHEFKLQSRMILKVQTDGANKLSEPYALNEVVVNHGDVSRLVELVLSINGQQVTAFSADGVIIATPTGSTAYALASGGPIVHPEIEGIIVAPISPFTLTMRPMVIPATEVVELQVHTEGRTAALTLDGQVRTTVSEGEKITVEKAPHSAQFVVFSNDSYYRVLTNKLNWGLPPRAQG